MANSIPQYLKLCNKEIKHQSCSEALEYVQSRFVTDELLSKYGIGFSPCEWTVDKDLPFCSRLMDEFPRSKKYLTKKLVFPILNYSGESSGFIIRSIGEHKFYKKFLFYPHMPFYNMYGLHENLEAIKKAKSIFLVESIFDLVAVSPWVDTGVALLGTAFLDSQMAFLKRYVNKVYLGFNNDSNTEHQTGNKATEYAARQLKKFGIRSVSIKLPDGINDFSDMRQEIDDLGPFIGNYF